MYKSPVLDMIKMNDLIAREQAEKEEIERQRLVAKKNHYAKYVNDFIRPNIKTKS